MKKNVILFCRLFVGVLFILSGLVKANDPMGFGYKLQEYYEVFGIDNYFNSWATFQAIFICAFEIVLGVFLLIGYQIRRTAWGLLLLILFFTALTFISAVFKLVTSCGCFGDAIPLTPWQSFSKDLLLLGLIAIIFAFRNDIQPLISSSKIQSIVVSLAIVLSLGVGFYTYNFLPFIDFLPYKVGANIPKLMAIPEGMPKDEYQMIYHLKNKKSGEEKDMTDKEYISKEVYNDDNWEIVGKPEQKLIKKGYQPPISDFLLTDDLGNNFTSEILDNPYYTIVIVAYDLASAKEKVMQKFNALAVNAAEDFNIRTICLVANSPEYVQDYSAKNKTTYEFFYADAVPLKSMVRANPGIVLLKNGTIVNKWHFHTLPSYNQLKKVYFEKD